MSFSHLRTVVVLHSVTKCDCSRRHNCGCLTCPGSRDGMGLFGRSKMVGIQGMSKFEETRGTRGTRDRGICRSAQIAPSLLNYAGGASCAPFVK